jgi:hypothetical protein
MLTARPKAREMGLAGATALRGLLGFGAHDRVHITEGMATPEEATVRFFRSGDRNPRTGGLPRCAPPPGGARVRHAGAGGAFRGVDGSGTLQVS